MNVRQSNQGQGQNVLYMYVSNLLLISSLKANLVVSFSLRNLSMNRFIGKLPLMFGIYFSSSEFSKLLGQFQPIKALICKKGCKLFKFK